MKQKFKVGDKVVLAKNSRGHYWREQFYDVAINYVATVIEVNDFDGNIRIHWDKEFFWIFDNQKISSEKESRPGRWFSPNVFEPCCKTENKSEYED